MQSDFIQLMTATRRRQAVAACGGIVILLVAILPRAFYHAVLPFLFGFMAALALIASAVVRSSAGWLLLYLPSGSLLNRANNVTVAV